MEAHRTFMRLFVTLALIGQIASGRLSDTDQYEQDAGLNKSRQFVLDSATGWRQVSQNRSLSEHNQRKFTPVVDVEVVSLVEQKPRDKVKPPARSDKNAAAPSVQWDDEGASNETDEEEDASERRQPAKKHTLKGDSPSGKQTSSGNLWGAPNMIEAVQKSSLKNAHTTNKFRHVAPYDGPPKYSKALFGLSETPTRSRGELIYHGRLAGGSNSSRVQTRVVAGLEVHIDTRKPVAISRFSPMDRTRAQNESSANSLFMFRTGEEQDKSPPAASLQEQSASSSDWRPIVVASGRTRRSSKTTQNYSQRPKSREPDQQNLLTVANKGGSTSLDTLRPIIGSEWRPLTTLHKLSLDKPDGAKRSDRAFKSFSGWTAFRSDPKSGSNRRTGIDSARNIEQPFDRDDELDLLEHTRDDDEERRASPSDELSRLKPTDRWKPLNTTTTKPDDLLVSSSTTTATSAAIEPTTRPPVGAGSQSSNSSSEAAQKSASDLSYIYSSQPEAGGQQALVQQQVSSGGGSYYGQPQIQVPTQQVSAAIVDTTSGQTPEMVPDRASVEGYPVRSPYGTYSDLQTVNFPPAQPLPVALPMRQQQPAYYGGGAQVVSSSGGGGLGFDTASYYQPARAAPTIQQPTRQSLAQQQLVRQEHHHHHYYNSQPNPSGAQSADRQQVVVSQAPPVQPTVIRELQPIMISQPVVQQASSSTAAPQIIREIIKEVPVQTVQVEPVQVPARFVVQAVAPPPPPMPVIPAMPKMIREVSSGSYESSPSYGIAPARRFMRQLSESMPQVAIRIPASGQFRLQAPSIQAIRSASPAASMTRQTGSFVVPPRPKKTTTLMTETQEIPLHTTIIHSTEYTPATRTTVYTTDHQRSRR